MNSTVKYSLVIGAVLSAAVAYADVVIDDFASGWAGRNKAGGYWIADSDKYVCNPPGSTDSTKCGTSQVNDPVLGEDIVKNSANVPTAYDGTGSIISKIKVSQDVAKTTGITTQNWAYAGWVMDLIPADTTGWYSHPWDEPLWDRKNDIDISGCTALQVKFGFTAQRQIWIELYNPQQEKTNPAAPPPQYGWRRYTAADNTVQTFTLPLTGLGSPVQKWTGTPTDPKIDLKHISRIKFLYEGQKGSAVVSPAPYDSVQHTFTVSGVSLIGGGTCTVPGMTAGIHPYFNAPNGLSVSAVPGALRFANLAELGTLHVQVRNLSGKVMAKADVNAAASAMDVSNLKNGVYAVQVSGSKFSHTFSITLLH